MQTRTQRYKMNNNKSTWISIDTKLLRTIPYHVWSSNWNAKDENQKVGKHSNANPKLKQSEWNLYNMLVKLLFQPTRP